MFSSASRTTARGLRMRAPLRAHARFQSTSTAGGPKFDYNALYGGLAGGSLVLAGTYAWYHLSGTRNVIQTAQSTLATAQNAKDKLAQSTPSPSAVLSLLRTIVKSYAPLPGLDHLFDQLDDAARKHEEKVVDIVNKGYREVTTALNERDAKDASDKVLNAVIKSAQEILQLSTEVGGDIFGPILDKSPELKRVLGSSYEQLRSTAEKHGPEAQRIASDTYAQLAQIVSQGVNNNTIKDAVALAQAKSKEISQLTAKSSADAWEAARNSAQPLLDRLPDLKKVLDENVENLKGYIGEERVNIVQDLYSHLEKLARSGKPPDEIKREAEKVVRQKVDELREQGGTTGRVLSGDTDLGKLLGRTGELEKLKSIPGLEGIVDQIPRLEELQRIAEKRGPEAKKLLEETYSEIEKTLEAKLEAAKRIGEGAKDDAKKSGEGKDDSKKGDSKKK